jgi:hypothetical protein
MRPLKLLKHRWHYLKRVRRQDCLPHKPSCPIGKLTDYRSPMLRLRFGRRQFTRHAGILETGARGHRADYRSLLADFTSMNSISIGFVFKFLAEWVSP